MLSLKYNNYFILNIIGSKHGFISYNINHKIYLNILYEKNIYIVIIHSYHYLLMLGVRLPRTPDMSIADTQGAADTTS